MEVNNELLSYPLWLRSSLNNGAIGDSPVDFFLPSDLFGTEITFEPSTHQKCVLAFVDIPKFVGVNDEVEIRIGLAVVGDALQTIKQCSGIDAEEAIDAHVAYIGLVACQLVLNPAVFLDVLPAGTVVKLFADLNPDQYPFLPRHRESLRH